MATANASSKGKTLGAFLGNKEGKELRENAQYCSLCDSDAEYYCNTCNSYLCNDCRGSHKRQRATKTHDIVHISNASALTKTEQVFCQIHNGVVVHHYCTNCEVGVCAICMKSDHKSHRLLGLPDAKEEIKNMCLEKVKHLQVPLSKMKLKRHQLEKRNSGENPLSLTERELNNRKDHLISLINATFSDEAKKLQTTKSKIETNLSQSSSELNKTICTCECLLTPIMSVVLTENVHRILKCSHNIDEEIKTARNILARLDLADNSANITMADCLHSKVDNEIRNFLKINISTISGMKAKSHQRLTKVVGLQLVNRTNMDDYYKFSSKIYPQKFYVQKGIGRDILEMSYDGTANASVRPLNKNLPAMGMNGYGFSVLSISSTRHVVVADSDISVRDNNRIIKVTSHTPDGYTPDNIAFVSDQEFVTICVKQKKIRYHNTTSLDVVGTYDLNVSNMNIMESFILLTHSYNFILRAKEGNENKLLEFSMKGEFIRKVPIHDEFFKYELSTVFLLNNHIICLQQHGSVHSFTLQGDHSCIGKIADEVDYAWAAGTDGTHLYVSYQKDYSSPYIAKFALLYK